MANSRALCKEYSIITVTGDAHAREWVAGTWRETGITYQQSELVKSEIYLETIPLFARGLVRLPDHSKLLRELRLLERQTHRSGRDSVDHPRGQHDDFSNSCCGALHLVGRIAAYKRPPFVAPGIWSKSGGWISDPCPTTNESTTAAFYDYHANGGGSWPGSNRSGYDW